MVSALDLFDARLDLRLARPTARLAAAKRRALAVDALLRLALAAVDRLADARFTLRVASALNAVDVLLYVALALRL